MKLSINLISGVLLVIGIVSCSGKKDDAAPYVVVDNTPVDLNWSFETTPSFADEFDYTGLPDPNKWGYDTGGGGWGNNELEYYTNNGNNATVGNGVLTITAKPESMGGMSYTSARLVSKGDAGSTLYGRIEVKAKLSSGLGTWPAIWMLPNDYVYGAWPKSGEVDIMEMVGYDPNNVHFSTHDQLNYAANSNTSSFTIATASTDYHLYREDWTPYAIRGYYDNTLVFTYTNQGKGSAAWPFDQKFHLLMNLAVGGDWGGAKGVDAKAFPTSMVVDYVHFFKMIAK